MFKERLGRAWAETRRLALMTLGVLIASFGYAVFLVPYNVSAGGLGGVSLIVNHFTGWSIGLLYLLLNIPMLVLGYFYLGRWRFLYRTVIAVVIFSVATDLFIAYLPRMVDQYPLTENVLLAAIYGGIIGGIGGGLIYRAGATAGGTGILGRVVQIKTGIPLSQIYLYTDGIIVIAMGLVFGWEISLYAMLALFLNGIASDYVLEGPSSVRTVTIVTGHPQEVAKAIITELGRTVSEWEVVGGYSGETRTMLMCTVHRPQVHELKSIVLDADGEAFLVIGDAHQAFGGGFTPVKRKSAQA
jgi:uncharacterized membrane-anchored protein YitT (DUF2179 family)